MQVAYASDCHLEGGNLIFTNTENAKVLILAGDICVASYLEKYDEESVNYRSLRIHEFFMNCGENFEHVIYIMGNHESYSFIFSETVEHFREHLGYIKNLHILDKESITIDDVTFVGGTLWTDMNGKCESTIDHIKYAMNDFRVIYQTENAKAYDENLNVVQKRRRFAPYDAINEFDITKDYIESVIKETGKYVVITHHAPSFNSVDVMYQNDTLTNGGYCSNLNTFIEEHPQVKYWIHGHTHTNWDYNIGDTNVLCNPRGYPSESTFDEFKLKYFEV